MLAARWANRAAGRHSAPGSAKRPAAARLDGILHDLRTATNPKAAPRYLGRIARILNGSGAAGEAEGEAEAEAVAAGAGGGGRRGASSLLFDSDESDNDDGAAASRGPQLCGDASVRV